MTRNREVDLIRLKEHLKALRLPTIQAECAKLAQECLGRGGGPSGLLAQGLRAGIDRAGAEGGGAAAEGRRACRRSS